MDRTDFKQIKELPLEFDKKAAGFHFKQVLNKNSWYVYEITDKNGGKWYDVFKEEIVKDFAYDKVWGTLLTSLEIGHIAYPGDECFGTWAWHITEWKDVEETIRKKSKASTL